MISAKVKLRMISTAKVKARRCVENKCSIWRNCKKNPNTKIPNTKNSQYRNTVAR